MQTAAIAISDHEFEKFQRFIHEAAGITLSPVKRALVGGRLAPRLRHHQLGSYDDYFRMLSSGHAAAEVQTAVDLLTTNETSFFREPQHFDLLRQLASAPRDTRQKAFRVWSAASSSGEEAYTTAMVLADTLPEGNWEVFGSDISTRVLERARNGQYALERSAQIPPHYLKRFCLRGKGAQEGTLLIDSALRRHVRFGRINLNDALPDVGSFDVIFLRNVMIYFNEDTKRQVVARLIETLKPGGHFLIGHAESLNGLVDGLDFIAPAVYRKRLA